MNIVTVGYLHGAGGAERQIVMLSNELAKRGHRVTLCVLAEYKSTYVIDPLVNVIDLTEAEKGKHLKILWRFLAFARFLFKVRPQIVINYFLQSAYYCLFLPKKVRGKIIYSERGDPYDAEFDGILGKVRDFTVDKIEGLVFQSKGAQGFFPEKVKRKSVVIPNSVPEALAKIPLPEIRDRRIVSVGRLHFGKNQKMLIEAFSQIASKYRDYTLEIYGDGEMYDELTELIQSLGLSDQAFIKPSRSDIHEAIRKASIFVLTSNYEGMPNALMEAMALGLPCIATDCRPGGVRSLIKDGENGLLVECNDPDALSKKIEILVTDNMLIQKLSHNARKIVVTNSVKSVFDKWDEFIKFIYNA